MGKILKPLAIVAAIAVNVIPGVGQVLSAGIIAAVTSAGITAALGLAASVLGLGPKSPEVSPANRDRLFANVDPATPRKLIFGRTAMATDIRYQEWTGNDQEYLHQIVCVASHKVSSIDQVYLDDELAWSNGAAVGEYAGYLTITRILEGAPGNTVTIGNGAKWGASRRMTGLAYIYMRFKVTGNGKKKESPFAQKIPSRMTVVGDGMPVYDPRFDSTNGGSGPMRPDDETTWSFSYGGVACGRNPANQLLTYLLGWRIANPADGTKKLAVGRGIPANRFDFAKWIAAANACDETVALSAGGTEPRYRSDGIFAESDDPRQVIEAFETAMNAKLRDTGGRFGVVVLSNDLATPRLDLDDGDVLGDFRWNPKGSIDQNYNEIRGRFTDPRTVSLYQLVDYPRYREAPVDGIERVLPFDLPLVQSPSQAQRLVKQQFARLKYQGKFEATLGPRGWALQLGDVVTLTFSSLGWGAKLFRVVEHGIRPDGACPVVLQEEHADIYLWDRDERPPVEPVELTRYDPAQSVLLQLLVAGEIDYSDGLSLQYYQPAEPGADITGLHTSANTEMVGSRTSTQVNNELDTQGLQIADIIVDVDDLQATYGDTASAATSAAAAEAARDAAISARDNATLAQGLSETARDASQTARDAAQAAETAALGYRDNAAGSASAAAGSASSASASETNAAQSATSASASANTATTKAGEASTSASQAATSETNAAGSASAAASSATVAASARDDAETAETNAAGSATAAASSASSAAASATSAGQSASAADTAKVAAETARSQAQAAQAAAATSETNAAGSASAAATSATVSATARDAAQLAAQAANPTTFEADGTFFNGDVSNANPVNASYVTTSEGRAARPANDTAYGLWAWAGALPHASGRYYRITARARRLAGTGGISLRTSVYTSKAGSTRVDFVTNNLSGLTDQFQKFEFVNQVNIAGAWVRPEIVMNFSPTVAGTITELLELDLVDVTESTVAGISATAAASSASSASASETAAGQAAASATTSANTATTKAGEASVSASQSASSATTAQGHANTASSASSTAATYRDETLGYRDAAAGSASAANTSATTAQGHASAASSSAASAASSSTLSATYRDETLLRASETHPTTFAADGTFFNGDNGAPAPNNAAYATETIGRVGYNATQNLFAAWVWENGKPHGGGKIWKVRAYVRAVINSPGSVQLRLCAYNSQLTTSGRPDFLTADKSGITGPAWQWIEHTFSDWTGATYAFVAPEAVINYAGTASGNTRIQIAALEMLDVTSETNAGTSASAAASSASSASASAASATSASNLAATYRDTAQSAATNAQNSATSASASAAAALSSQTLVASYVQSAQPTTFENDTTFFDGDNGLPGPQNVSFLDGPLGRTVTNTSTATHGSMAWAVRMPFKAGRKYLVRTKMRVVSGDGKVGLRVQTFGARQGGPRIALVGANQSVTVAQGWQTVEKIIDTTGMGGEWAGAELLLNYPPPYVSKQEAVSLEMFDVTETQSLTASVTVNAGAIATLEGRTTAFWQVETVAGLGNGATAFISARAETSPGNVQSTVAFGAREIHLYNPTTSGWAKSLSVFAGEVVVYGSLTASAGIYLGTGVKWQVALRSKSFTVQDGVAVSYGVDFGTPPIIEFSTIGLAPLNSGETYALSADNSTGTGFTPRLKISTPGTTTQISLTTDTVAGSGPTRQIDKGANADAPNNTYTFVVHGTFTDYAYYEDFGGPGLEP